jgi:hypothetical protein
MEAFGYSLHISCRYLVLEGEGDYRALNVFLSTVRYYQS